MLQMPEDYLVHGETMVLANYVMRNAQEVKLWKKPDGTWQVLVTLQIGLMDYKISGSGAGKYVHNATWAAVNAAVKQLPDDWM